MSGSGIPLRASPRPGDGGDARQPSPSGAKPRACSPTRGPEVQPTGSELSPHLSPRGLSPHTQSPRTQSPRRVPTAGADGGEGEGGAASSPRRSPLGEGADASTSPSGGGAGGGRRASPRMRPQAAAFTYIPGLGVVPVVLQTAEDADDEDEGEEGGSDEAGDGSERLYGAGMGGPAFGVYARAGEAGVQEGGAEAEEEDEDGLVAAALVAAAAMYHPMGDDGVGDDEQNAGMQPGELLETEEGWEGHSGSRGFGAGGAGVGLGSEGEGDEQDEESEEELLSEREEALLQAMLAGLASGGVFPGMGAGGFGPVMVGVGPMGMAVPVGMAMRRGAPVPAVEIVQEDSGEQREEGADEEAGAEGVVADSARAAGGDLDVSEEQLQDIIQQAVRGLEFDGELLAGRGLSGDGSAGGGAERGVMGLSGQAGAAGGRGGTRPVIGGEDREEEGAGLLRPARQEPAVPVRQQPQEPQQDEVEGLVREQRRSGAGASPEQEGDGAEDSSDNDTDDEDAEDAGLDLTSGGPPAAQAPGFGSERGSGDGGGSSDWERGGASSGGSAFKMFPQHSPSAPPSVHLPRARYTSDTAAESPHDLPSVFSGPMPHLKGLSGTSIGDNSEPEPPNTVAAKPSGEASAPAAASGASGGGLMATVRMTGQSLAAIRQAALQAEAQKQAKTMAERLGGGADRAGSAGGGSSSGGSSSSSTASLEDASELTSKGSSSASSFELPPGPFSAHGGGGSGSSGGGGGSASWLNSTRRRSGSGSAAPPHAANEGRGGGLTATLRPSHGLHLHDPGAAHVAMGDIGGMQDESDMSLEELLRDRPIIEPRYPTDKLASPHSPPGAARGGADSPGGGKPGHRRTVEQVDLEGLNGASEKER